MADSMEAPNIVAARNVVSTTADGLTGIAANTEQLVNDMLAGGMNNDPDTVAKVNHAQELTDQAAAAWRQAHAGLSGHQDGEEYANSGHAANTDWLKDQ